MQIRQPSFRTIFLFLFFLQLANLNIFSGFAAPKKDTVAAKRWNNHMNRQFKDWLYAGVEAVNPQLRYGYKATEPWVGPSFMFVGGMMQASFLRGMAEVQDADSGKTYRQRGSMTIIGFNIPIPILYKIGFELVPTIGFGFNFQALDDRRRRSKDEDMESNQFGFYVKPAVQMKIGPAVATLSYHVGIGANFTDKNAVAPFTHFPALGLYLSSMPILMNPRDFTASGQRHYRDLVSVEKVNSGMSYYKKVDETPDYIKYRKEAIYWVKSTYSDRFENESIKVKDVKPFTYLGPRISSTYFTSNQLESATNVGANLGFRYGLWWMNAFAETGDVLVKSPEKPSRLEQIYNSASYPVLSGRFQNSVKFGGQLGIDLVVRAIKSDFKPHYGLEKETRAATSFTAIVPYVGYGQTRLGTFQYGENTTREDVEQFETLSNTVVFKPESFGKVNAFYNFGLGIHVGAFTFGMDYYYYPEAKKLNGRQIYAGLNLPIARIVRAAVVRNYQRKLLKQADKTTD